MLPDEQAKRKIEASNNLFYLMALNFFIRPIKDLKQNSLSWSDLSDANHSVYKLVFAALVIVDLSAAGSLPSQRRSFLSFVKTLPRFLKLVER